MNWIEVKLTDISNPKQWKNLPMSKLTEEGYPVYGANGMIGYYPEFNHLEPTIAITCRGATCGSLHITKPQSYITSNAMALDDLDREKIDQNFLYYLLKYRGFNDVISGSAQPQITRKSLEKVRLSIPDTLTDQVRIATLLSRTERLIEQRRESIHLLDELVKGVFLEMFRIDKDYQLVQIKEIANKEKYSLSSGPFGSNLTSKHYTKEGVLVLRSTNITSGKLTLFNVKYISEDKAKELERSEVKPNDIVIIAVGVAAGKSLKIPSSLPRAILSQNFNKVSPDLKKVTPDYLEYCFNNDFVQRQFFKYTTDTARQFLSLTKIKKTKIPLPPHALQQKFSDIVQKTKILKKEYEASLADLENLYGSLSQQAFRGELDLSGVGVETKSENPDKPEPSGEERVADFLIEISKRWEAEKAAKKAKEKGEKVSRAELAKIVRTTTGKREMLIAKYKNLFDRLTKGVTIREYIQLLGNEELQSLEEYEDFYNQIKTDLIGEGGAINQQYFDEEKQQIGLRYHEAP